VADKKIIEIPVDSSQWDAFVDSWQKWNAKLETMPDSMKASTKGVKEIEKAWAGVGSSFDKLVKVATSDKFASPTSGSVARLQKSAKETEKSWTNISRLMSRSEKSLESMARHGLSLNSIFGLFGSAGLLAGGIYGGVLGAASGVAADNKSSKSLGLDLGKESAFAIYGKQSGLDRSDLENAENAKQDVTKQTPYLNAGITDFSQPADVIAWAMAKREGQMYSQWEKTSEQFALSQAQVYFPGESADKLRLLAKNVDNGTFDTSESAYNSHWRQMGVDQATADQATAFDTNQSAKWKEIETAWNKDILLLAPHLDKWSDAAVGLTTKFLDTTAKTVDDLADAADHPTPPGTPIPHAAANDYPGRIREAEQIAGQWARAHVPGVAGAFNNPDAGSGSTSSEDAILAAISHNEDASGNPNAVNPVTGAAGVMGIMPANYKRAGIDPFDPAQNRALGKQIFDEFLTKYHGDTAKAAAAYDGFKNLDADIAKYGDSWRDHINEFQKGTETTDYLNRLEKQGIVLGNMDAQTARTSTKGDDFPVVPYVEGSNPDADINAPQYRSINGLNDVAANLKALWHSTVGEGAGARYRHDDTYLQKRIDRQGGPSVINSTVTVNAPPGHDVNVSTTQLAQ
jgi:hypothetical protein